MQYICSYMQLYVVNQTKKGVVKNIAPEISVSNSAQYQSYLQNYDFLLPTALVNVNFSTVIVIMCQCCSKFLNLKKLRRKNKFAVGTVDISAETSLNFTKFKFSPYFENNQNTLRSYVVNQVTTTLPNFSVERHLWLPTVNIQFADLEFNEQKQINLCYLQTFLLVFNEVTYLWTVG